jgi:hypothetical protein
MKVVNYFLFVILIATSWSCEEDVSTHDVIEIRSSEVELSADGSSTAVITALIPEAALPEKRIVTFKTTVGLLEDSIGETRSKKLSLKADRHIGDHWVATTRYTSGLDAEDIQIYASIEGKVDSTRIILKPAMASKIQLASDAFAVAIGYVSEINLVASLSSATGKASKGHKVKFIDTYENGTPVNGSFRNLQVYSDDNSQVKATYSPGPVASGTYVTLKAIVLDSSGTETDVQSSIKIYLKPE